MNTLPSHLLAATGCSLLLNAALAQPTVATRFPIAPPSPDSVFTRMYDELPAFSDRSDTARRTVQLLGGRDGLMNAQDDLSDPVQSILKPAVFSPNNPDNPNVPAGVTFLGQFLDHDLALDRDSTLEANASPSQTANFRTAAFDLDSVYGEGGPQRSPQFYDTSSGRIKFIVQAIPGSETVSRHGAVRADVPRDRAGNAVIADSRNDENVIVSQLHVAMLAFHNAVTDYLAGQPDNKEASAEALFAEARRVVTWHYQWIVLHEFLPAIIGQDRVDRILSEGLKSYRPKKPAQRGGNGYDMALLPIEFAVGAYRFGHSQARPSYRLNFGPDGGPPFFALLFDDTSDPNAADPVDLRGGKRAPRRFVDWQTFFDFRDGNVRPNKRIDTKLSSVLMTLPGARAPSPGLPVDGLQSLPARTLTRHVNFGLPSGQAIAEKTGQAVLEPAQLSELAPYAPDSRHTLDSSTPLFFYVLKEAEVMENGLRLGPVGSAIVGEVFIGVLQADRRSYLSRKPEWRPFLPSAREGHFLMTDLLRFAGVVPPL